MPRARRTVERSMRRKATELEVVYRRSAIRLLGREREEVTRFVANAAKRGGDRAVRAAVRVIERQYTSPRGAYHVEWVERFADLNAKTAVIASRELGAATNLRFDLHNPNVIRAMRDRAVILGDYVGEGSAKRVSNVVQKALKGGGSTADIRDALRDGAFGEDISMARATRIARTEAIGALNEGEYATAVESDVFTEKEWLHSGNPRDPREWHMAMDGERVSMDEPFSNGLMFPHEQGAPPEEVIHCGCSCLFHV